MNPTLTTSPDLKPDSTTEAVREFYEQYPYPAHPQPLLRAGFDARLVLSYSQDTRPVGRALNVLDAGCGRGVGLLTVASLHSAARFVGVDLCSAALEDVRAQIAKRGLTNIELAQIDLMTLEGLAVPNDGFDLIYSSGVVHHMSDPSQGLRKLSDVLAPTGSLVLMLYGTIGRRGIERVKRALAAWVDSRAPLREKLASSRLLVEELAQSDDPDCPWRSAANSADAEFVDRYLHPNETDYDVPGVFDLLESAGLRFLRWMNPSEWSLDGHMPKGALRETVEALPDRERFTVIEQILRPKNLQLIATKPTNSKRCLPPLTEYGNLLFATHPEVRFEIGARNLWQKSRVESIAYALRDGDAKLIEAGPIRTAAFILASQNEPFRGATLLQALIDDGVPKTETLTTLRALVQMELVYMPHEVELS